MRRKVLLFTLALSGLWNGCAKEQQMLDPGLPGDTFAIDATDYATNYFFVDTSYVSRFGYFFAPPDSLTLLSNGLSLETVWVERLPGEARYTDELRCKAMIALPIWYPGSYDRLRGRSDRPGEVESGWFRPLTRSEYSLPLFGAPGIIVLRTPVSDDRAIAVSYRSDFGYVGEFPWGVKVDSTIFQQEVLISLIKPRNFFAEGPSYATAWRLLLKNVYKSGYRHIDRQNFRLEVRLNLPGNDQGGSLFGRTLMNLLGLDVLDQNGCASSNGDGQFDFAVGRTIDAEYGEIIFPELRPFDNGITDALQHSGIILPSNSPYRLQALYDSTQSFSFQTKRGLYTITGRAIHF